MILDCCDVLDFSYEPENIFLMIMFIKYDSLTTSLPGSYEVESMQPQIWIYHEHNHEHMKLIKTYRSECKLFICSSWNFQTDCSIDSAQS